MSYNIGNKLAEGTYTNVYVTDDGLNLIKAVKNPDHEDLLDREEEIVGILKTTKLADLFPDLHDTTQMGGMVACEDCPQRFICFTTNVDREKNCKMKNKALVYTYDKDKPSLVDVMSKYPDGIDERDMVWMYKRLLAAVWTAHSVGIVHCAVLPEHVLLDLKTHGIWLLDWMHTNKRGITAKINNSLVAGDYKPPFVVDANNLTALDIHMATMCMVKIMGGIDKVSRNIRIIMRACMTGMTDAKEVHEQLEKTVKKLYGQKFRPFKV